MPQIINVRIVVILCSLLLINISSSKAQFFKCADLPKQDRLLRVAILPDTQGDSNGENGVAQKELLGIKNHLLNHVGNVDFVLHVGDVSDAKVVGVPDDLQESKILNELLLFNSLFTNPLAKEGIPFYPIVGNHDCRKRTPWKKAFPFLFDGSDPNNVRIDPYEVPGSTKGCPYHSNYSYVVKHSYSNTYFVLLDAFGGGDYYNWLSNQLKSIRDEAPDARIFCIQHMPLYALAWHYPLDNIINAGADDNPKKILELSRAYRVEGWFAGHNHYYHRAMFMDGDSPISFDFTCGAAAFKVYDRLERHPRDTHKVQVTKTNRDKNGLFKANYLVMDIHKNFVVIKTYYSDENPVDGSFKDFYLADEYVYSTNGKQVIVEPQETFTKVRDESSVSEFVGTSMAIIDGINTDERTYITVENKEIQKNSYSLNVTNGWYAKNNWFPGKNTNIISDILVLRGLAREGNTRFTAPYTLTLSYDDTGLTIDQELSMELLSFMDYNHVDIDAGHWYKASYGVSKCNNIGIKSIGAPSQNLKLGEYGVDTLENTVWVRLDYEGDFAVGISNLPMPDYTINNSVIINTKEEKNNNPDK